MPPEPAEHHPADERGDEAGAADRLRKPEPEKRARERDDLEPGGVDEAARPAWTTTAAATPRDHAAEDAVADLLQHELGRGAVSDRAVLASATASAMKKSGTQIPSFSPLSTLRL